MTTLHIVIIGAAAYVDTAGQTPQPEDVTAGCKVALDNDITLRVHLIDPQYKRCCNPLAADNTNITDEYARITAFSPDVVEVVPQMYHRWTSVVPPDNPCIYITYEASQSSYDIMGLIESPQIHNRWYRAAGCSGPRCNITDIVTEYVSITRGGKPLLLTTPYDVYSGDYVTAPMSAVDLRDAKDQLFAGCSMVKEYIKAEFHKVETTVPTANLSSWVYNVETPILKGIILKYSLYPPVPDQTPASEMRESGDYRRRVAVLMCQVLSNFAINNKLMSAADVVGTGGWYSIPTWVLLQKRLTTWDGAVHQV